MRNTIVIFVSALAWAALSLSPASAQEKAEIEGYVLEAGSGTPVDYAWVFLPASGQYAMTDEKGFFSMQEVDPGKVGIQIQYVGLNTVDTLVTVLPGKVNEFMFRMQPSDFRMEEVVVTATRNKAGESTASTINRQAIDHMQASSLTDVMQLLPGSAMSNSDLGSPNVLSIRSIDGSAANSLGTALIIDGDQQSNNANLQVMSPTSNGSTSNPLYFQNTANSAGGVDTRTVSLDNVESVEVIRGIPSAEYGDLTAGAVIVKSKTGQTPLNIKFSARPEQYQGSVAKGIRLGEKGGTLNLSGDYLYTIKRPIESYWNYRRFTASGIWSKMWGDRLSTKTTLNMFYGMDRRTGNPDNNARELVEEGRDLGFKLNTTGTVSVNAGWLKTIEYGLYGSYTDRHSYKSEIISGASGLYSTSTVDGSVTSSHQGVHIFDNEGNEITNLLPGTEDAYVTFLPDSYRSEYNIFGKEIYGNAKVKAVLYKTWGEKTSNRIIAGAEYRIEGNRGAGKVYDNDSPPSPGSGFSSDRIRHYYDIPFINRVSAYVEDTYSQKIGRRDLIVSAGLRFDHINGKQALAPRINASFEVLPDVLSVRGGYGITTKAPTLLYLYPENGYFDMPLFASTSSSDPAENLVITKTNVYSAENPDLEIEKNMKSEAGIDLTIAGRYTMALTGYYERCGNGYSLARDIDCFHLVEYPVYKVLEENPGSLPTLTLDRTYKVWQSIYKPSNTAVNSKYGVEMEMDLGRFDAIRTSFYLSGAWMRESSTSSGYSFSTLTPTGGIEGHVGIYAPGRITDYRERMVATLRMTHNIPKIGFAVTLTTQFTPIDRFWSRYGSDMFVKYLSMDDGKVYDFDPAKADDPEFSYLFENIASNRETVESRVPTLYFNLTLTKEIGKLMRFSFFANNALYSRPIYQSTKNPTTLIELGNDIFFGFDLSVSIK